MTRRTHVQLLATALTAGSLASGKDNDTMHELFQASLKEKKGLTLYVKGQTIAGVVVSVGGGVGGDTLELRSREYSRIVVRFESIDAVAMA
jgi:hypothetical protein